MTSPLRLHLDMAAVPAPEPPTVYVAWCNDLILDVYGDRASAEACLEDYRASYPGDWRQSPSGRWSVLPRIWRLAVEPRVVRHALPLLHADGASRATNEAL